MKSRHWNAVVVGCIAMVLASCFTSPPLTPTATPDIPATVRAVMQDVSTLRPTERTEPIPTAVPTQRPALTTADATRPTGTPVPTVPVIDVPTPASEPTVAPIPTPKMTANHQATFVPTPAPSPSLDGHPCANGVAVPSGDQYLGLLNDCRVLLDAKDTLAGNAMLPWTADIAIRRWRGIELGGSPPRVTEIRLDDHGLTGQLSPELGGLTGLTKLELRGNRLSGPIPPELGQLGNLTHLRLEHNRLTGPLPPELGDLSQLKYLFIHVNRS